MALIVKNQQNNWSYILVLAGITFLVGGFVIFYAQQTIQEINNLSSPDRYQL
ncbi:MAG: hypothetical protein HYT21_02375 [Candidatus Nealsonbacteria bacterium]|nr:hypothetical protein [Candidatus Nealsonbacteria bacterium]